MNSGQIVTGGRTGIEGSIRGPHRPKNHCHHCHFLFKRKDGGGARTGTDFQYDVYANSALESENKTSTQNVSVFVKPQSGIGM